MQPRSLLLLATGLLLAPALLTAGLPTAGERPYRLSSNENAFGYSPKALAAMKAVLESGNYYNWNNVGDFLQVAAEHEKVDPSYLVLTAGSGPVLEMTAAAFARPGVNVVTTAPGYPQLTGAFTRFGGTVKYTSVGPDKGYDWAAMTRAIDDDTAIVYICNPNNPTGVLADPAALRRFILSVPAHILVFVDEAYLELSDTGLAANTMAPLVKVRPNLIVSRTFSKAYGMAGIRAGYGIAQPDTLEKIKKFYLGGPTYFAAVGAAEALKDREWMEYSRGSYIAVRNMVCSEFDRMGINYAKPQGAFVLFDSTIDSATFQEKMKDEGILVTRPFGLGEEAGYDNWVRVSFGTEDQMQSFLGAMQKILGKT